TAYVPSSRGAHANAPSREKSRTMRKWWSADAGPAVSPPGPATLSCYTGAAPQLVSVAVQVTRWPASCGDGRLGARLTVQPAGWAAASPAQRTGATATASAILSVFISSPPCAAGCERRSEASSAGGPAESQREGQAFLVESFASRGRRAGTSS